MGAVVGLAPEGRYGAPGEGAAAISENQGAADSKWHGAGFAADVQWFGVGA